MAEKKYNSAIIGCGSMGVGNIDEKTIPFTYSFAGAVLGNPRAQLVALVDSDSEKATKYGERFGVPCFSDWKLMLDKINPDIVCCAAGPKVNSDVIKDGVERGLKGIYCEKPLSLSLAGLDELSELEKRTNTKIQVNYLRNYDIFHNSVLDFVRQGGIGNLQLVRILYNGGVNAVFPHATALLGKLFNRAIEVSGVYSPIKNITTEHDPNIDGSILFRFEPQNRNVTAQLAATGRGKTENNTYYFEIELTGSEKRLSILHNGWTLRSEEIRDSHVFGGSARIRWPYETSYIPPLIRNDVPREFMIYGLSSLIDAIENNTPTLCNINLSRNAEEISHALAISAENQGKIIKLPLEGDYRNHRFEESLAGVDLLRRQNE